MLHRIGAFYLIAMALVVVITIYLAGQGHSQMKITMLALFAWPLSALILLARHYAQRIHGDATETRHSRTAGSQR